MAHRSLRARRPSWLAPPWPGPAPATPDADQLPGVFELLAEALHEINVRLKSSGGQLNIDQSSVPRGACIINMYFMADAPPRF
jgi:hypothetical protein